MCGIAGSINTPFNKKDLELIKHRGPDYQNFVEIEVGDNKVYFAHARLSILDLSEAGNQPMFSDCGKYCIIYNGEIYNHLQLRTQLTEVSFKGHSDTETILYYIRKYGIDAVKNFNGIFAFAFLDLIKQKVYLVRDHFGVKPLYYFFAGKKLVFASELKVILSNSAYQKEVDLHSLNALLTFRYNPSPDTIFKNIYKLKAAHYITYDFNGRLDACRYWNHQQKIDHKITKTEAIEEYRHLLNQAVNRQLLSDVPVGLLLSGGLDSAVLGFLMSKNSNRKIKSFTIGFEGKGDYNELPYAKETAELIQSDHYETVITKDSYINTFYDSFYHVEEPIAEPTIPALYSVSRLASQHVKVVLSGQGIDEPMAGYKRYYGEKLLSKYKPVLPYIPLRFLHKVFPRNHSIARGAYALQFDDNLDRFIGIYTIFTSDLKRSLYHQKLGSLSSAGQRHYFENAFNMADAGNGSLSQLLFIDTRVMLPDDLLLFNDKMTMANSIENRVPYLDVDLVNFIESLPVEFKLKGKIGKYLHREAVKDWIPDVIIHRKKRGFATPVDQWFQRELSDTLLDLVKSAGSFSRDYFMIDTIENMIHSHKNKKHNYKHELFLLFSLEMWHKNFYTKF